MKKLYIIGNAHIDPVWLWRWQEGFSEILATYRSALDRIKEYPDFKFTSACASYYEWVEQADPGMFAEIKERVAEGRWGIAGGWYLQPDCNIPCGESFARHALVSQRFFKEKFGVTAKTGYNVDSFGHSASLPQILKKSGMDNYVFMRPMPHEKELPSDLFEWESADGSRVRTFRLPAPYNIDADSMQRLEEIKDSSGNYPKMAFCGVGNHGGGPTIRLIEQLNAAKSDETVYATPDEYFAETAGIEAPVVRDELQHHARGCYSAMSFIKKANRRAESSLLAAEALCALSDSLMGTDSYPSEDIKKAWKNLLFNQFHDIQGGCSIKSAYTDASYLFGEIMAITERVSNLAMTHICHQIDTLRGETLPSAKNPSSWRFWSHEKLGTPVAVFNPHAWEVVSTAEVTSAVSRITDNNGADVPFQHIRAEQTNDSSDKFATIFEVKLPPLGYKVFRIFTEAAPNTLPAEVYADEGALENDFVRVEFDKSTGDVCIFADKHTGKRIISKPCSAVLLDETDCDTWAHDKVSLGEKIGAFGEPEFEVIERGTVRSTIRVTTRFGNSTLRRDYSLYAGSDSLEVKLTVDFHEKHRTLKLSLPVDSDKVCAATAFGAVERPLGTGEEPCGEWLASGEVGFASDSVYGYDTTADELRPTLLRSAIYADHFGKRDEFCEFMEQGVGEYSYILFPFTSRSDAERRARVLNYKPRVLVDSFHDGKLSEEFTGFACESVNIVTTAVKRGEASDKTVCRFYEADGESAEVTLEVLGKKINVKVKPYEIRTFKGGVEVNLVEWEV